MKKTETNEFKEFESFPILQKFLQGTDREIRWFKPDSWKQGTTREKLVKRQQTLLDTAQKITAFDVIILFYIYNLKIPRLILKRALEEEYRAQCKRKNLLLKTDEYSDPFDV